MDEVRRSILRLGFIALAVWTPSPDVLAADWTDTRTAGPFVCRADFALNEMDGLFGDLAQLQDDLIRCLGIPPAAERIELYLFHDQTSYRRYLGQHLPQVPYRRALYVKLDGPGMVFAYRSREFDVDLRHECAHALLHAVLPVVPLWLDEGLAEYFEVPPARRAYDHPHLSGVRWAVRFGLPPKLDALEKKTELSAMGRPEYRGSWAWVHFMIHGSPEAHDTLIAYLRDIRLGDNPGLFSQRLQEHVPDLSRRFSDHFKRWNRP